MLSLLCGICIRRLFNCRQRVNGQKGQKAAAAAVVSSTPKGSAGAYEIDGHKQGGKGTSKGVRSRCRRSIARQHGVPLGTSVLTEWAKNLIA